MCNVWGLDTINICILWSYEPFLVALMSFTKQTKYIMTKTEVDQRVYKKCRPESDLTVSLL